MCNRLEFIVTQFSYYGSLAVGRVELREPCNGKVLHALPFYVHEGDRLSAKSDRDLGRFVEAIVRRILDQVLLGYRATTMGLACCKSKWFRSPVCKYFDGAFLRGDICLTCYHYWHCYEEFFGSIARMQETAHL